MRSVTVRQLREVDDDGLDGMPLEMVTLIGKMTHRESNISAWCFDINDGTGVVEASKNIVVNRVINSVEERVARESIEHLIVARDCGPPDGWVDDIYYRVVGVFNSKSTCIDIDHIRPVTNMNELTMHFIECVYQHAQITKRNKEKLN